jgi:hypothetical protein
MVCVLVCCAVPAPLLHHTECGVRDAARPGFESWPAQLYAHDDDDTRHGASQ